MTNKQKAALTQSAIVTFNQELKGLYNLSQPIGRVRAASLLITYLLHYIESLENRGEAEDALQDSLVDFLNAWEQENVPPADRDLH